TTGEKGDPVQVGDSRDNLAFFGDAEHPLVATDDAVALLEPDLTGLRWQTAITDEYLNIANGGLVGDTIVVDGEHSYGLDVGTGDVRWERDFLGGDAAVVEDAWIVLQSHELRRCEVSRRLAPSAVGARHDRYRLRRGRLPARVDGGAHLTGRHERRDEQPGRGDHHDDGERQPGHDERRAPPGTGGRLAHAHTLYMSGRAGS